MAALTMKVVVVYVVVATISVTVSTLSSSHPPYNAIFNFGDSISDTGNSLFSGQSAFVEVTRLPYGQTFFGRPTGRCSDGRLIIDFIAEAFGLPYLPPYLSLSLPGGLGGVNFAVAGATALDPEFFYRRRIVPRVWAAESLTVQLGWFKKFKSSLCATQLQQQQQQDCKALFKRSIFFVGEIGGNDYNLGFFNGGFSIKDAEALVPLVVEAIIDTLMELIEEGAVTLVVPGNFPIGCTVVYLTLFQSQNKSDYDSIGCLKALNAFGRLHNVQLNRALDGVRLKYPHANIIYADYYGVIMEFVRAPERYGFHKKTLLRACCGAGGAHNFNHSLPCGSIGTVVCEDPASYASWDGIHLTEAAYRIMADGLLNGPFTTLPLMNYSFPLVDLI